MGPLNVIIFPVLISQIPLILADTLSGSQVRTLYQKAAVTGELQQPFKLQSIYLAELRPHCVLQGNSSEQARLLNYPSCSLRMSVLSAFTGESIHFKCQTK